MQTDWHKSVRSRNSLRWGFNRIIRVNLPRLFGQKSQKNSACIHDFWHRGKSFTECWNFDVLIHEFTKRVPVHINQWSEVRMKSVIGFKTREEKSQIPRILILGDESALLSSYLFPKEQELLGPERLAESLRHPLSQGSKGKSSVFLSTN